mgnify:CR=1 FL=1
MILQAVRFSVLGTAALLAVSPFLAQAQEGGQQAPPQQAPPGGGQPPAPGTPSVPSPMPSPGQREPQQPQQRFPTQDPTERSPFPQEMDRPIFLSGKVVLEDGTPPPDPVTIERVCNGIARPEAYTDSKGRFSFQLGQNMSVMPDASVSSSADMGQFGSNPRTGGFGGARRGVSERELMGCELRAALPGFRSEVVNLAGRRVMDNPDVGTIILRRLGNVEGLTISATSALAPKDAQKAFEKGREEFRKQKWDRAQKELEKAVQIYPKYAAAWHQLGLLREQQKQLEQARDAYAKALEADAKSVSPYLQIAQLDAREGKWQEVADTTDRIVRLNPFDFPQAFFYNSVANFNLRKLDNAEKSAREAVKLDTQRRMPKASHLLGLILAQKEDYPEAAEHIRNYLKFQPQAADADQARKQLAEIERLGGLTSETRTAQPQ